MHNISVAVVILINILTSVTEIFARELINQQEYQKIIDSVFPIFPTIVNDISPKVKTEEEIPKYLGWVTPTPYDFRIALCTTACLQKQIFVVSARCIMGKTPGVVSVFYESKVFLSLVIIIPKREEASKHYHDDVGLIVTTAGAEFYRGSWPSIAVIQYNRTDNNFQWLYNLNWEHHIGKADTMMQLYGFSQNNGNSGKLPRLYHVDKSFVGSRFCEKAFKGSNSFKGYLKPCVHTCYEKNKPSYSENCTHNFLDGAAVVDERRDIHRLLGFTTWTVQDTTESKQVLPQGIAIPNSNNFWNDYKCAIEVVKELEKNSDPPPGHLQQICDRLK